MTVRPQSLTLATVAKEPSGPQFRSALKRFATGVTVITTVGQDRAPVGLTANSFNSVSLDPPLVLWSLDKNSRSSPIFRQTRHYAICVLGSDQINLARQFASPIADRFAGVAWRGGKSGMPILENCAAWFECEGAFQHEAGDHTIFVGQVLDLGESDRTPLLYSGGSYGVPAPHPTHTHQTNLRRSIFAAK